MLAGVAGPWNGVSGEGRARPVRNEHWKAQGISNGRKFFFNHRINVTFFVTKMLWRNEMSAICRKKCIVFLTASQEKTA